MAMKSIGVLTRQACHAHLQRVSHQHPLCVSINVQYLILNAPNYHQGKIHDPHYKGWHMELDKPYSK